MLHQLIYVSQLTQRLKGHDLQLLVRHCEESNRRIGVSGVLLVHGRSVMQLLEGDEQVVEPLFTKISRDPRHSEVAAIMRKTVAKRLYPEWGMGLTDLSSPLQLDRGRMMRMLDDIRATTDTRQFSVEARILLRDFEQQAAAA